MQAVRAKISGLPLLIFNFIVSLVVEIAVARKYVSTPTVCSLSTEALGCGATPPNCENGRLLKSYKNHASYAPIRFEPSTI